MICEGRLFDSTLDCLGKIACFQNMGICPVTSMMENSVTLSFLDSTSINAYTLWLKKQKLNLSAVEGHLISLVIKWLINIHHRPCLYDTKRKSWKKSWKIQSSVNTKIISLTTFGRHKLMNLVHLCHPVKTVFAGEVCPQYRIYSIIMYSPHRKNHDFLSAQMWNCLQLRLRFSLFHRWANPKTHLNWSLISGVRL